MISRKSDGKRYGLMHQEIRGLLLFLSSCLVFSYAAQAQTYYVSKSGSDSNSGLSAKSAWLTIGHAALQAQAGSTVYVAAGTYRESVAFANSGTASAPIVFDGQGVAVVDGSTGVPCCTTPSFAAGNNFLCCNTQGLFNIGAAAAVNHLTIKRFTLQNYITSSTSDVPVGVLIAGGGTGIRLLNN